MLAKGCLFYFIFILFIVFFVIRKIHIKKLSYEESVGPAAFNLGLHCLPMLHLWDTRYM